MAAGGWKPYSNAPRVELVQLRELCERDRASPSSSPSTPPPESILERLFDVAALPKEVFWHVISFWRSSRDDQEDVEPDETDDDDDYWISDDDDDDDGGNQSPPPGVLTWAHPVTRIRTCACDHIRRVWGVCVCRRPEPGRPSVTEPPATDGSDVKES